MPGRPLACPGTEQPSTEEGPPFPCFLGRSPGALGWAVRKPEDISIQEMLQLLGAGGEPWRGLGRGFCRGRLACETDGGPLPAFSCRFM